MPNIAQRLRGFGRRKPGAGYKVDWSHQLAQGLRLVMPFSEGGGNPHDYSSFGNNGTLSPLSAWQSGFFGGPSLSFNGTSTAVTLPGSTSLDVASGAGFGVFAWVIHADSSSTSRPAVLMRNASGVPILGLYCNNNGAFGTNGHVVPLMRDDSSTLNAFGTTQNIVDGNWHLIGMARSGTTFYCYIDLRVFTTGTTSGSITTSVSSQRFVGEDQNNSAFFKGSIDLPLIYNRFVTPAEVAWLYAEPFAMFGQRAPARASQGHGGAVVARQQQLTLIGAGA